MAACTFAIGTADTGASPNTSGAFTPALGDLLVAFVVASGSVGALDGVLTSSIGGFTFTRQGTNGFDAGASKVQSFISDALVSSATSQTVTWDDATDASTGTIIFVFRVSGMVRTGSLAKRQTSGQNNQAAGTPAPVFAASCLTGNPVLGCIANLSSPAGMTAPTGWAEPAGGDLGYSTPTTGGQVVSRDSGFTGTTVTWGSSSATAFGSHVIELDASAGFQPPRRSFQPFLAQ